MILTRAAVDVDCTICAGRVETFLKVSQACRMNQVDRWSWCHLSTLSHVPSSIFTLNVQQKYKMPILPHVYNWLYVSQHLHCCSTASHAMSKKKLCSMCSVYEALNGFLAFVETCTAETSRGAHWNLCKQC